MLGPKGALVPPKYVKKKVYIYIYIKREREKIVILIKK